MLQRSAFMLTANALKQRGINVTWIKIKEKKTGVLNKHSVFYLRFWIQSDCLQQLVVDQTTVSPNSHTTNVVYYVSCTHTHTHTCLMVLCPGLPEWAGTRKVKPIWILLKQETVSGSGISRAICKSASRSKQISTPAPHHSVFYRPDALPAAQPTV